MELKTRARKWGDSIAIIIPKPITEFERIKENDEVIIEVRKNIIAKNLFGKFPRLSKKSAQELKDDARKGWR